MLNPLQTTYSMKVGEVDKKWVHINAEGLVLGRLSSIIAMRLRGKHRVDFTPNIDSGDNVIVTNAHKVVLTGNKFTDSLFFWHTGHPGGVKSRTPKDTLRSKNPERLLMKAVERMMPKTKLGRRQMSSLRVYCDDSHPHSGQSPVTLDIKAMNKKNAREN